MSRSVAVELVGGPLDGLRVMVTVEGGPLPQSISLDPKAFGYPSPPCGYTLRAFGWVDGESPKYAYLPAAPEKRNG